MCSSDLILAATLASVACAQAQSWPSKPVQIIVPFAAGGAVDIAARILSPQLQEQTKQPFIVVNKPGAGGNIGTDFVAKSAPDGHTILLGTAGTHMTAVHLVKNLRYDPVKDFAPVIAAIEPATCLVAHPSLPVKNVPELIAYAKANPGKLSYGSTGVGSFFHLAGELFNQKAGVKTVHVPYKGADAAITDLIGGHIPLVYTSLSTAGPHIQSGAARLIATLEPKRFSKLPDAASISEALPAFQKPSTWFGFFAPRATPAPVIARLNAEIDRILNTAEVRGLMEQNGYSVIGGPPERLTELMVDGIARFGEIVKAAGIEPE